MNDEELIARLRSLDTWAETADVPDLAADRIKQLVAKYDEAVECNEEFFVYNQILKEQVARLAEALRECHDALRDHAKMYPHMVKGFTHDAEKRAAAALAKIKEKQA